jgi:hypothetical protein
VHNHFQGFDNLDCKRCIDSLEVESLSRNIRSTKQNTQPEIAHELASQTIELERFLRVKSTNLMVFMPKLIWSFLRCANSGFETGRLR